MRTIISFLVIVALATSAYAQGVARPVPQVVKSLSDSDYAIWAQWQNRQTDRRAAKVTAESTTPRYNYFDRMASAGYNRASLSNPMSPFGSRIPAIQYSQRYGSVTTAYRGRLPNPDYTGPGHVTHFSPWARSDQGKGTPAWDKIFVPCREGTTTMQEVLDMLTGPADPEAVYRIMLEGYFSIERQPSE